MDENEGCRVYCVRKKTKDWIAAPNCINHGTGIEGGTQSTVIMAFITPSL
jgi:hypothetical protein